MSSTAVFAFLLLLSHSFSVVLGLDLYRKCGFAKSNAPVDEIPYRVRTPYFVKIRDNYPFEEHFVETKDGYILGLHRIPFSPKLNNAHVKEKRVVFIQHGLECSSTDWILNGPEKSLGYLLADAGYDVWMGNARGNTYSRNHTKLNPNRNDFWLFDWHEIALLDMPALIDKALKVSGQEKLHYIGHSQGGTVFLVLSSLRPDYTAKTIYSSHLLAPVCFCHDPQSPLVKFAGKFFGFSDSSADQVGLEVIRNTPLNCQIAELFCRRDSKFSDLCANFLFLIGGHSPENLNKVSFLFIAKVLKNNKRIIQFQTNLRTILSTFPAGSSWRQITHYLQLYTSKRFQQFDFGTTKNLIKYGKEKPPKYPLKDIRTTTFFYVSRNDWLVDLEGTKRCTRKFAQGVLGDKTYVVPYSKFSHFDFLWGINAREMVYEKVLHNIQLQRLIDVRR